MYLACLTVYKQGSTPVLENFFEIRALIIPATFIRYLVTRKRTKWDFFFTLSRALVASRVGLEDRGQVTGVRFLPSILWVLGIRLRWSGLAASTSAHRAISPAQKDALKENLKVLM